MNAEAFYHVHKYVIPTALSLLPNQMATPQARAMLLAIGLQESAFMARVQENNGPAHGYWQFEKAGGVRGVLHTSNHFLTSVCRTLNYDMQEDICYRALIHNDTLACVFARLLLWTVPGRLPQQDEPDRGWQQYIQGWRPGKPRPVSWPEYFTEAWRTVLEE